MAGSVVGAERQDLRVADGAEGEEGDQERQAEHQWRKRAKHQWKEGGRQDLEK